MQGLLRQPNVSLTEKYAVIVSGWQVYDEMLFPRIIASCYAQGAYAEHSKGGVVLGTDHVALLNLFS